MRAKREKGKLALVMVCAGFMLAPNSTYGQRAQATGDGPFVMHTNELLSAAGDRLRGVDNPSVSDASIELFPGSGGINRNTKQMHLPGTLESRVRVASDAGLRTLATFVGTQFYNASDKTIEPDGGDIPPYARSTPIDMHEWASTVVSQLQILQDEGIFPDYVEIWNEPDRWEWWSGTREEFLALFEITANAIRSAFPEESVKIGGPGLAGMQSEMDGGESLLLQLVRQADENGHPLDFLSFHHYSPIGELRYFSTIGDIRALLGDLGMSGVELLCSEYNINPGNDPEYEETALLDRYPPAAKLAGMLTAVADLDLDGNMFFQLQDNTDRDLGVGDHGMMTRHGIRKPVLNAAGLMYALADQPRVQVDFPDNEWAASVFATRHGSTIHMVVANNFVNDMWVYANGCREQGAVPKEIWAATELVLVSGLPLVVEALMWAGLSEEESELAIDVWERAVEAQNLEDQGYRDIEILLSDASNITLLSATRFDSTQNAPAEHQEELQPLIDWAEEQARELTYNTVGNYLEGLGVSVPPYDPEMVYPHTPEELAEAIGISIDQAETAFEIHEQAYPEMRLANEDILNSQPATVVVSEDPADAGVHYDPLTKTVTVTLEHDAVVFIDLELH